MRQAYERVRAIFEKHRTFLSLSATIASCAAAWLGYQARVRHQHKLEEQLQQLSRDLKTDQQQQMAVVVSQEQLLDYKYV